MARSGARPHINVILRIRVNIGFPPALRYVVAAFWGKNQANRIRRPTIMGNTSTVRIASAMLAIAIAGTAAPAQAQTLFDMLFKKKQRERVVVAPAPQPASTAARQPVKKVTVAPARYYSYHASKPVTFAAKEIVPAAVAGEGPSLQGDHFIEALRLSQDMELMADRAARDGILAYYAKTPEFVWVDGYAPNARAEAALSVFADAASVGLDPRDYQVDTPGDAFDLGNTADRLRQLLRFELTMSAMALRYAHDAMNGRITPNKLSDYHDLDPKPFVALHAVMRFNRGDDLPDTFEHLAEPDHRGRWLKTVVACRSHLMGKLGGPDQCL